MPNKKTKFLGFDLVTSCLRKSPYDIKFHLFPFICAPGLFEQNGESPDNETQETHPEQADKVCAMDGYRGQELHHGLEHVRFLIY